MHLQSRLLFQFLLGCYSPPVRREERPPERLSIPFRMLRPIPPVDPDTGTVTFQFLLGCYEPIGDVAVVELSVPFQFLLGCYRH